MSVTPTEVLQQYAHALHIAAPREWEGFLACFDAYATAVTVAVISADQTEILNRQGRAQLACSLLTAFRDCDKPRKPPPPTTPPSA